MKTLDRHVLMAFLRNYCIALAVLIGMYITLDMVLNFDELFALANRESSASGFATAMRAIGAVADFYFNQSVLIFVQLSPLIPVLAAAFTLMRMTRFNELTAVLAAGVPLWRLAAPIALATCVLTGLVFVAQEVLVPAITPKLLREHSDVGRDTLRSFPVNALEDTNGGIVMAARYNPGTLTAPASMVEVDVLIRDEQRRPVGHVRADRAFWEPGKGQWRLEGGRYSDGLTPEMPRSAERAVETLPTTLTPEDVNLYRSRGFVELLSTARINQLLGQGRAYGVTDLLRVKHFRITHYLSGILLLLLALPCVMSREQRTLKQRGVLLLGVVGSFLGTVFMAQHLAGTAAPMASLAGHWPALMAAMPVLVFTPLAVVALDRIKT
jgi:lipopolysaccharide export system permease protein